MNLARSLAALGIMLLILTGMLLWPRLQARSQPGVQASAAAYRDAGLIIIECIPQSLARSASGGKVTYHDPKLRDGSRISLPPGDNGNLWSPGGFHIRYYPGTTQAISIARCDKQNCVYRQEYGPEREVATFSSPGLAGVWNLWHLWDDAECKISIRNVTSDSFDFTIYDYHGGEVTRLDGVAGIRSDTEAEYIGGGENPSFAFSILFQLKEGRLYLSSKDDILGELGSSLKVCAEYTSAQRIVFKDYSLVKVLSAPREQELVQLMLGDTGACKLRNWLSGEQSEILSDGSERYHDGGNNGVVLDQGQLLLVEMDGAFRPEERLSPGDYAAYARNAATYLEQDIFAKTSDGRKIPEIMACYRERLWEWTDGMAQPFEIPCVLRDLDGDGRDDILLRIDVDHPDGTGYAAVLIGPENAAREVALPAGALDTSHTVSILAEERHGLRSLEIITPDGVMTLHYDGDSAYLAE